MVKKMRKHKLIYTVFVLLMICIIFFSGMGGTYLQVRASSPGLSSVLWNDDKSAWENIKHYMLVFMSGVGLYPSPSVSSSLIAATAAGNFLDFMISDNNWSNQEAHDALCGCGKEYTSCPAFVEDGDIPTFDITLFEKGGGGRIRDGISRDDDGNVTYSDEVSDLFHGYILDYLGSAYGFYIVPTMPVLLLNDPTLYSSSAVYESMWYLFDSLITETNILFCREIRTSSELGQYIQGMVLEESDYYFVLNPKKVSPQGSLMISESHKNYDALKGTDHYYRMGLWFYDKDWKSYTFHLNNYYQNMEVEESDIYYLDTSFNTARLYGYYVDPNELTFKHPGSPITKDGRNIRIFKNEDSMKMFSVNKQPYYATNTWYNYNSADDNSITVSDTEYNYYINNGTNIYQTIQDDIDNTDKDNLTDREIQEIVEKVVVEIKIEIETPNEGGNGGSGDGVETPEEDGGGGIFDLLKGIGKIFDTLLSVIGMIFELVADFTTAVLNLFSGFTSFTEGFSQFLSAAFGFIPPELIQIITTGLTLMLLLAVLKFFRK